MELLEHFGLRSDAVDSYPNRFMPADGFRLDLGELKQELEPRQEASGIGSRQLESRTLWACGKSRGCFFYFSEIGNSKEQQGSRRY